MTLDEKGIVIEVLAEGKAGEYGVRKGWKIKEINLEDFTDTRMKEFINSNEEYYIEFSKDVSFFCFFFNCRRKVLFTEQICIFTTTF